MNRQKDSREGCVNFSDRTEFLPEVVESSVTAEQLTCSDTGVAAPAAGRARGELHL